MHTVQSIFMMVIIILIWYSTPSSFKYNVTIRFNYIRRIAAKKHYVPFYVVIFTSVVRLPFCSQKKEYEKLRLCILFMVWVQPLWMGSVHRMASCSSRHRLSAPTKRKKDGMYVDREIAICISRWPDGQTWYNMQ